MLIGFIRTLGTILLVWFVFRWLDRVFGSGRRSFQSGDNRREKHTKNPDVQGGKPQDDGLGEYVDFEEVKED